ncbi:unnamed protein product [Gordionus sp. m RMFG-2023]|uniref:uncharacterized protein LOC135928022 isoform X1 n=1 Tax=Gordionus sp. m RMFG-2023 TaxID=3053472 RepID=UPI0030E20B6D
MNILTLVTIFVTLFLCVDSNINEKLPIKNETLFDLTIEASDDEKASYRNYISITKTHVRFMLDYSKQTNCKTCHNRYRERIIDGYCGRPHTGSINDHKLLRQINDEQGPMFLFNNDIIKQEIHIPTCQVKQICCTGDQIGMSSANAKTIKNVLFYRPAINGKQACIVSRDLRVPCCECQLRCPDLRKDINVNYVSQTKVSTCTKWC